MKYENSALRTTCVVFLESSGQELISQPRWTPVVEVINSISVFYISRTADI
jgi:hypothetical protein